MIWSKGFTASYYMTILDASTWRDIDRYEIISGSISRSGGTLMEAADLVVADIPARGDVWVRIYLDAQQDGSNAHVPLFTGIMSAPAVNWEGLRKSYKLECYSVLKPAADVLLQRGWYAPAGMNGAMLASRLLSGIAPVEYDDNAPDLATTIVAEDGESNLTMAQKLISAIGWRIRISGDGHIRICPQASEISETFDALENDCIELAITDNQDWFSCPNVFRAVSDDLMAVARDDESIEARGREIWMEETNCALNADEGIAEYAVRRLKEEQAPARRLSYNRRFHPDLYIGDMVRIHHPAQKIDGEYEIETQRIELGYGARTAEGAIQV